MIESLSIQGKLQFIAMKTVKQKQVIENGGESLSAYKGYAAWDY